jgi:Integrase core domain
MGQPRPRCCGCRSEVPSGRWPVYVPHDSKVSDIKKQARIRDAIARNAIDEQPGCLQQHRYVLHDRDTKFCAEFREILATGGAKCLRLPPRSPNLNAFSERWVRSVKSECLSKLILFGESSLRRAPTNFCGYYHAERPHQGKENVLVPNAKPAANL